MTEGVRANVVAEQVLSSIHVSTFLSETYNISFESLIMGLGKICFTSGNVWQETLMSC